MLSDYLEKVTIRINTNIISRYCSITYTHFKYFKSKYHYELKNPPLFAVLIKDIISVHSITFQGCEKNKFYFLIKVNEKAEIEREPKCLCEKNDKNKKLNRTINSRKIEEKFSEKGHLMRPISHALKISPEKDEQNEEKEIKIKFVFDEIRFKSLGDASEYQKYFLANKEESNTEHFVEELSYYGKNHFKASKHSWTYREIDWYLSENNLIFSVTSKVECDRWVSILNFLMKLNKTNMS